MHSHVHLVVVFTFPTGSSNKLRLRENIRNAEVDYAKLLRLLESSGLKAVGKAGRRHGEIIVLVHSPMAKLNQLARLEQSSDFQHGVLAAVSSLAKPQIHLPPSHRIRILHDYLTSPTSAGGLGISPGISQWKRVVGIYPLHDPEFDWEWVRSLTKGSPTPIQLDSVRDNYGEEVGLYFAFLATYTKSLTPIAVLGATFHLLGQRYSPFYSIVIVLWATFFAEYWAVCERKLAVRWGSHGSSGLSKPPPKSQTTETRATRWWTEDLGKLSRLSASIVVLLGFVCALVVIAVVVFVLEAFLAILYKGPGSQFAPVVPMILFAASAPIVLGIYRFIAIRSTDFERHDTRSTYAYSLAIKRFILSTIVSYFGITLSAFIYMPFGRELLGLLHLQLFAFDVMGMTSPLAGEEDELLWEHDLFKASMKLNGTRLQTQMFAFLVTAQLANAFQELGMPYVIRWLQSRVSPPTKMKQPGDRSGTPDEKLLDRIKEEVSTRLDYDVFDDYCEMVTQFGYIAIWSSIWPLAPAMACLNNWLEGPSDAFKLTTHLRKPIPVRVESIGAWLYCIRGIAWVAAVVNTVLVCLYHPDFVHIGMATYKEADFKMCLLIGLTASHAFLAVRYVVRMAVEKMYWQHSEEKESLDRTEQRLRGSCLDTLSKSAIHATQDEEARDDFWTLDEGLEEILRGSKED